MHHYFTLLASGQRTAIMSGSITSLVTHSSVNRRNNIEDTASDSTVRSLHQDLQRSTKDLTELFCN
jgi:hypothetical protein